MLDSTVGLGNLLAIASGLLRPVSVVFDTAVSDSCHVTKGGRVYNPVPSARTFVWVALVTHQNVTVLRRSFSNFSDDFESHLL
jgi:hypothetical protein